MSLHPIPPKEAMRTMAQVGDVIEQDGKKVRVTEVDEAGEVKTTEPVEEAQQTP